MCWSSRSDLILGLGLLLGSSLPAAEPNRVLVPAYGHPCCGAGAQMWEGLIDAARPGVLDVILNPNSGPGSSPIDRDYIGSAGQEGPLLQLARAGADIYGYVHTSWGRRDLTEVFGEIDRYFDAAYYRQADFHLSGIFIDEMSNDLANLAYYQSIKQHLREKAATATLIGNPGTSSVLDSSRGAAGFDVMDYATVYDRLVTFENDGVNYRNAFSLPAWIRAQPAQRFAHIVHSDADADKMAINVQLAASRNVGTLYVTDDLLPNPYDRLPTYWQSFLAATIPPVAIDELSRAVRLGWTNHHYDFNQDGRVDQADRLYWIDAVAKTSLGDANLDGQFNSHDLVAVFQAGEYEDGLPGNSFWSTGDWNGDGEFDTQDLIEAFETGRYESGIRPVPEPNTRGGWLCGPFCWFMGVTLRRKPSC